MPELQLPDVTLAYDRRGEGPDFVWLAGGDQPGSDWHLFQTPAFPDFRNTTYDARGVGATVCHTRPPWSMAARGPSSIGWRPAMLPCCCCSTAAACVSRRR